LNTNLEAFKIATYDLARILSHAKNQAIKLISNHSCHACKLSPINMAKADPGLALNRSKQLMKEELMKTNQAVRAAQKELRSR